MSIQMQLWSIEADRPVRLPSAKLDLEARLERWKQRQTLSFDELAGIAGDRGVGELYRALQGLSRLSDQVGTTQSNVTYRWRLPTGGRAALNSVHPKASGLQPGPIADIRVEDLARHLGLAPKDLRAALPEKLPAKKIPGLYLYAEGYAFRSLEEVERFLARVGLGGARNEEGARPGRIP